MFTGQIHTQNSISSSLRCLDLCLLSTGLVSASKVRLSFSACAPSPYGESVQWFGRRVLIPSAETAGYVRSERGCEETIDDRIATCVEVAEDEESMMDVFWHRLQHTRLEPVPNAQQVVRCPAHHKWCHDDDRHLQGLHACFGNHVGSTASQTRFPTYKTQHKLEEDCVTCFIILTQKPFYTVYEKGKSLRSSDIKLKLCTAVWTEASTVTCHNTWKNIKTLKAIKLM